LAKQLVDPFLRNTDALWSSNPVNLLGYALLPDVQYQLFYVLRSKRNQNTEEEVAFNLLHILKLPVAGHVFEKAWQLYSLRPNPTDAELRPQWQFQRPLLMLPEEAPATH